ncbi:MAG: serine protease [Planctomycetota bacterium]
MHRFAVTIAFTLSLILSSGISAQIDDVAVQSPSVQAGTKPPVSSVEIPPIIEKSDTPVGQGSGLWKWTPTAKYHDSIVEVSTSGGTGTGVLIKVDKTKKVKDGFEGLVLTAWHVIQDDIVDGSIKVTYRNKRRAKGCQVMEYDEATDVAVLWVWVPNDVEPAKLATKPVQRGDCLELVGLGGGTNLLSCVRAFEASASPPTIPEKIFADAPLLPGDSGGPVFNKDHEVVGIISGGWFWWDSGLKTASGGYIQTTWPARASNIGPIHTMMAKINAKKTIAKADSTTIKR